MNLLKKLFPFSFKATQLSSLLAAVIVCVLVDVVCGWVIGLVAKLPLVGWIFLLVWTTRNSQPGPNRFGPNPKEWTPWTY